MSTARAFHLAACTTLLLLIGLCFAWELHLAPLRPGGSWLAVKALPLLLPLPGVLKGNRYTVQWAALLVLVYLLEGVARAASESGTSATLSVAEITLAAAFFAAAFGYLRFTSGKSRE